MLTKSPRFVRLVAALCLLSCMAFTPTSADAAFRRGPQRRENRQDNRFERKQTRQDNRQQRQQQRHDNRQERQRIRRPGRA